MSMKHIRDLFDQTRPIDRQITSVINYAGATEDQLEREIREYEVTDSLARHYERLLNHLSDGFSAGAGHEIGVWVSGFYGSGKARSPNIWASRLIPGANSRATRF